jgi:hypothetical protein
MNSGMLFGNPDAPAARAPAARAPAARAPARSMSWPKLTVLLPFSFLDGLLQERRVYVIESPSKCLSSKNCLSLSDYQVAGSGSYSNKGGSSSSKGS